jgi:hypothetical protein
MRHDRDLCAKSVDGERPRRRGLLAGTRQRLTSFGELSSDNYLSSAATSAAILSSACLAVVGPITAASTALPTMVAMVLNS